MITTNRSESALSQLVLPRPTRTRFQPLRAGILNIWEYDDQEFWFHDGRLILRGANETGKSKALELLLPFLFDADLRPQRLDPFGERSKTMFWNLVDFDPERTAAIGYCWLEFGRLDEEGRPSFVTIGAGMRASRGAMDVKPWYFVTRLRMCEGFSLLDGRTPLTHDRLAQALGKDGKVYYGVGREYRGAVDRALFDLGDDRYAALVHLLLQLRRPHLSDNLDPETLSDVLTESLPPLDDSRIAQLAGAFDSLDAEAEALAALEQARDAVLAFRDGYRSYARLQARRRAADVRSAVTRFDDVTRRVRKASEAREKAVQDIRALERERGERKVTEAALEGERKGLEASEEMQAAQRLSDLKREAETAREAAMHRGRQAEQARADFGQAKEELAEAESRAATARARRTTILAEASRAAGAAGLMVLHEAHTEAICSDPVPARAALETAAIDALRAVSGLRARQQRLEAQTGELGGLKRRAEDLAARRDRAEEEVTEAVRHSEDEENRLEVGIRAWLAALDGVAFTDDAVAAVVDEALRRVAAGQSCASVGHGVVSPHLEALRGELSRLDVQEHAIEERRAELTRRRADIEAARDEGPAPRAGRSADRTNRPGGALWQLCDFADGVPPSVRSALEAALEAAGILDAWLTPEGRLLDADELDAILVAGRAAPSTRTLGDLLVPTPSEQVPGDVILAVLRHVAVLNRCDDAEPWPAWVTPKGHWRLGPLRGKWSKAQAEYIGAATRAATRARRLAAIAQALAELDLEAAHLAERARLVGGRRDALQEAAGTFPSGAALLTARAGLEAAGRRAREARGELEAAQRDVVTASGRLGRATADLRKAAAEAGLLDALDDLDARAEALQTYRRILVDLAGACERDLEARDRHASVGKRCDELAGRVKAEQRESEAAERKAKERAAEAEALERRVGATARKVLELLDRVLAEQKAVRDRLEAIGRELAEASKTLGGAEAELTNANQERGQREAERTQAIERLAELTRSEFLALAVPDAASALEAPPWAVKVAVELARAIESQTSDVSMDEAAANQVENNTFQAYASLRTALGAEFDPTLSKEHDLLVVTVRHNAKVRGVAELAEILTEEVVKRGELLERDERELIERHLLGDVGLHLQDRLVSARRLIEAMNGQLAEHPTNSGIVLRLRWVPTAESGEVAAALRLLQRDVRLLVESDQEALVRFLRTRITGARQAEGGGTSADRMARALDYRRWHRFEIVMLQDGHERVMTRKAHRTGSGGSRAVLVHLPLFAAASAHYRSARPEAPHVVTLDEAFDGVDPGQRGSCMGLLAEFDLDFVLTNYEEWGCYEELPGVATYHLSRESGRPGVAALRFVWDGLTKREDDPFLRAQMNGVG